MSQFYSKVRKNSKTSKIEVASQKIDTSNQNDNYQTECCTREKKNLLGMFATEFSELKDQVKALNLMVKNLQNKVQN